MNKEKLKKVKSEKRKTLHLKCFLPDVKKEPEVKEAPKYKRSA